MAAGAATTTTNLVAQHPTGRSTHHRANPAGLPALGHLDDLDAKDPPKLRAIAGLLIARLLVAGVSAVAGGEEVAQAVRLASAKAARHGQATRNIGHTNSLVSSLNSSLNNRPQHTVAARAATP